MVFLKMCQCTGLAKKFVWLMNMLFNKVHCENEKCLLFLPKTKQTFWPTQYIPSINWEGYYTLEVIYYYNNGGKLSQQNSEILLCTRAGI